MAHPQDTEDAEVERLESIKRILSVPGMRPLDSHDKILAAELSTCDNPEHSADSIPFILHQVGCSSDGFRNCLPSKIYQVSIYYP